MFSYYRCVVKTAFQIFILSLCSEHRISEFHIIVVLVNIAFQIFILSLCSQTRISGFLRISRISNDKDFYDVAMHF